MMETETIFTAAFGGVTRHSGGRVVLNDRVLMSLSLRSKKVL